MPEGSPTIQQSPATTFQKPLYDDVFGSNPIKWNPIEPSNLTVMQDVRNRVLKGVVDTGKGIADLIPLATNLFAPEDTQVHNVMNKWINNVAKSMPVYTEEGVDEFDFMQHPTAGNFMRGMGSLMGMVVPIGVAAFTADPAAALASFGTEFTESGILPAIMGLGKTASATQRAASMIAFGSQMATSSIDELKANGINGKGFDYMVPAMAMTGMASAYLSFGLTAPLIDKAVIDQITKGATRAAIDDVQRDLGKKLSELTFDQYSKPLLKSLSDRSIELSKRFLAQGAEGGVSFGAFTGMDDVLHTAAENMYDSYFSPVGAKPGEGKFGAAELGSKDQMTGLFKDVFSSALTGMMFQGGLGLFHPLNYDSAYSVVKKAVDTGNYDQVKYIKSKINDRVMSGKMTGEQGRKGNADIDGLVTTIQDFNQKFPKEIAPNDAQRKQLFNLFYQRKMYEDLKTNTNAVANKVTEAYDPIAKKAVSGDIEKKNSYFDAQIKNVNDLLTQGLKDGGVNMLEAKQTLLNTYNEYHPNKPIEKPAPAAAEEVPAEPAKKSERTAITALAKKHGFNSDIHAMRAYNKYVASEELGIPKLKSVTELDEKKIEEASVRSPEEKGRGKIETIEAKTTITPPSESGIVSPVKSETDEKTKAEGQGQKEGDVLTSKETAGTVELKSEAPAVSPQPEKRKRGRPKKIKPDDSQNQVGAEVSTVQQPVTETATAETTGTEPKEQRTSESPRATQTYLDAVVSKLKKALPNVQVITDRNTFKTVKENEGITGDPLGFVSRDGRIFINMDKVREDTPIHEFGHIWSEWTKANRPSLWQRGLDIVSRAPNYLDEVAKEYPELSPDRLKDEAIARAIGKEGVDVFKGDAEEKSLTRAFKDWLDVMWDRVKRFFGFDPSEDVSRMQLKDFAQKAAKELFGEKPLTGEEVETEAPLEQRDRDKDGVFLSAQAVAKNNNLLYHFFRDPDNHTMMVDHFKAKENVDFGTMDAHHLERFISWANAHDDNMNDLYPFVSRETAMQVTEALTGRPEIDQVIRSQGGIEKFAEKLYDNVYNKLFDDNPINFSPSQKAVFDALIYFKNILKDSDVRNMTGMTDPKGESFIHSGYGEPVTFAGETPMIAYEGYHADNAIKNTVIKAEGSIADTIAGFNEIIDNAINTDKDVAGNKYNHLTDTFTKDTRQMMTEEAVTNLMDHYENGTELSKEASDLRSRLSMMQSMYEWQKRDAVNYVTGTGSMLAAREWTDAQGNVHESFGNVLTGQGATSKAHRTETLKNNPVAKILNPILETFHIKGISDKTQQFLYRKMGIQSLNLETIGLKLFGDENSEAYKFIVGQWMDVEPRQAEIRFGAEQQLLNAENNFRKGSTYQNPDSFRSIRKQEFTNYLGETHNITQGEFLRIYAQLKSGWTLDTHLDTLNEEGNVVPGGGSKYKMLDAKGDLTEGLLHLNQDDFLKMEQIIQSSPEYSEMYKAIRDSSDTIFPHLNRQHYLDTGAHLKEVNDYFPVRHSVEGESLSVFRQNLIDNFPRTKPRGKAETPLASGDAIAMMHRYIEDSAQYATVTEPLKNMDKFIHYEGKTFVDMGYGDEIKWLGKFTTDMAETKGSLYSKKYKQWNYWLGQIAKSRIMFNPSPDLKQAISYTMANNLVAAKYLNRYLPDLTKTLAKSHLTYKTAAGAEDILAMWQKHSPMLYMRAMGRGWNTFGLLNKLSDHFTSEGVRKMYTKDTWGNMKRTAQLIQNLGLKPINFSDTAVNTTLQRAIMDQLADERPDLTRGSDEFNQMAAKKCEEVVRKSQHGYDPVMRTELQRATNPITNAIFLFTGQLQKQHNLLYQSYYRYLYDPSGANLNRMRKIITSTAVYNSFWVGSITLLNAQISGYKKPSDDEFKDLYIEAIKEFGGNFPMMGEAANMIASRVDQEKWQEDLSIPQLDLLNQSANAFGDMYKGTFFEDGKTQQNFQKGMDQTARISIQALGLPYKIFDLVFPRSSIQK